MELTIEHAVEDYFTVKDQHGCYLDANGNQTDAGFASAPYLQGFEVLAVVQKHIEAQSA